MILRRGDVDHLTGNAIVYWDIIGKNTIAPGFSIFAVNFTVSPLPLDNKLLTATFPPIPFKNVDGLFEKLNSVQCDIIYGGELKFPKEQDAISRFYKNEFAKYNTVIEEYIDVYKEKFNFSVNRMSEKEKLDMLKLISQKVRIEIREGKNSKKGETNKLAQLIETLEQEKYDILKFKSILFIPGDVGDQLVQLYTQKFFAIYHEKYEDAYLLKNEISEIEKNLEY